MAFTAYSTFWVYVVRGSGLRDGGSTISGRSPQSVADELGLSIFTSATGTGEDHHPTEYIEITFPSYMFPAFGEAQGTYSANDPSPNSGEIWVNAPHEDVTYIWRGIVRMVDDAATPPPIPPSPPGVPPGDPPAPPTPPAPATKARRFIDGFELANSGEAGVQDAIVSFSRDASRTFDGWGMALRQSTSGPVQILHTLSTLGAAASRRSWERFYLRLRKLPASEVRIWQCHGVTSNIDGAGLYVTATGTLKAWNIDAASTKVTNMGETAALTLGRWYRIDLLLAYAAVPPDYHFQLAINGTMSFQTVLATAVDGLGRNQNHATSGLGLTENVATTLECDFDDWVNADYPVYFGYDGNDWIQGSHIQAAKITGFGPTHSISWVGDWRTPMANPVAHSPSQGTIYLEASAASAILDAVLVAPEMSQNPCAALLVAAYNNLGGGTAQIGYNINGSGESLASVTSASSTWMRKLYTTTIDPAPDISTLNLIHVKDTAVSARRIIGLHAVVEMNGVFGPEDMPDSVDPIFAGTYCHNSPYPSISKDTPISQVQIPAGATTTGGPITNVALESGTYIGNGLGQDVLTSFPPHWIRIRPLTGDVGSTTWWSSMLAAHTIVALGPSSAALPQAVFIDAAHSLFRVSGTGAQTNAAGVTYQWTAVSDPGMRFIYNGASRARSSVATYAIPFPDTGFAPDAALVWPEDATTASTPVLAYKGPGCSVNQAVLIATAGNTLLADAITLDAAGITTRTDLNTATSGYQQSGYSAWKLADRGGTTDKLFAVTSYVGNGAGGTRDIALSLGSNWPLWVAVVPVSTGGTYTRDASHTGANSSIIGGGNSTTAITAGGVDKITVGTTLNVNAVTYAVFALRGHPDGWYNGTPIVLTPAAAGGSQFVIPGGVGGATDTTNLIAAALASRTNMCDRVLHRLGDTAETIWTKDEMYTYLRMAAAELADRTKVIWDQMYLDDIMELTGQRTTPPPAVVNLPLIAIEVERASISTRGSLEAFAPSDTRRSDNRYEITTGEIFGYTWKHDGIRGFRMVRLPSVNPVNVRIDYWRHFEVSCSLSELQPRYFLYLSDYMQWKSLIKHGPGQDYKLAQLYKDRWERGIARILNRINRRLQNRIGQMGGTGSLRPAGPPRPRLPWQYGSKIRP